MKTVTLKEFLQTADLGDVLIDIDSCPLHTQTDYVTRNENVTLGRKLCGNCDGTGNEFMSMYHQCPKCSGKGWLP